MTLKQFILLDDYLQATIVWENGAYLASREILNHTVMLYQVQGFYVEVFYAYVTGSIVKIVAFQSTELLDPYLEQIDIQPVLQ